MHTEVNKVLAGFDLGPYPSTLPLHVFLVLITGAMVTKHSMIVQALR